MEEPKTTETKSFEPPEVEVKPIPNEPGFWIAAPADAFQTGNVIRYRKHGDTGKPRLLAVITRYEEAKGWHALPVTESEAKASAVPAPANMNRHERRKLAKLTKKKRK